MSSALPTPQRRAAGGEIRWATGSPSGPRSQTWRLFGNRNSDDIYLGPRWDGDAIKLSLHRSGKWRMAWTDQYAKRVGLPDGSDRVLARWDPPTDIQPGWQHAVTILVTPESMSQFMTPELRPNKVAFYPRPEENHSLWFRVLLGQPGAALTVRDAFEVGTLALPGGGMVGILVRPGALPDRTAAHVAEVRARMMRAMTQAGAHGNRGFSWGRMDDGAVVLIDPGPIEPEGRRSGTGRPGRVFSAGSAHRAIVGDG